MNNPTKEYYDLNAVDYAKRTLAIQIKDLYTVFATFLESDAYVLDLGCGAGRDLKELSKRGFRVLGVDFSAPLAEIARGYSGQEVLVGDIRSLDFSEGQFDGIWAIASLLHIPRDEISRVLRRLYYFLRPGGVFLTSMQRGEGHEVAQDGRHFELYLPEEWEALLRTVGFRMLQHREVPSVDKSGRGEVMWVVHICRKEGASENQGN